MHRRPDLLNRSDLPAETKAILADLDKEEKTVLGEYFT